MSTLPGCMMPDGADPCDAFTDLQKQLAERDAALARCVEALRELRGVAHTPGGITLAAVIDDTLAFLPASAQATAKVQQWRPIETAPKDGAMFIAYQNGSVYECRWVEYPPDLDHRGSAGFLDMTNDGIEYPTHWMPLPEPPKA